jgi:D-sedoheptulose 7-phosphate isomerase
MTTVFTNGCFDLLHPGHISLLERARALGSRLVVGINSDASVRAIKGAGRPVQTQDERAAVLRGLRAVDEVHIYDEATPARLIEEIKPDVLVKGGDWPVDQIIGADFVLKRGGKVFSLPLEPGFSSSNLVEKVLQADEQPLHPAESGDAKAIALNSLAEHATVIESVIGGCLPSILACGAEFEEVYARGGKVLLCGNGGSAADAQHIAAEFVGRFEAERRGLPAIALTTDTSALTAITNDHGYERVFARQVEALAVPNDLVVGISTSGTSPNVLAAIMAAQKIGCRTVGMTGAAGKRLASLCDAAVLVPSVRTARIQEAHIVIGHIWCEMVDAQFAGSSSTKTESAG